MSTKKREYLLMVLDALGKWSLIDAFVMTLMIVAFRFHIQPPDTVISHHPPVDSDAIDVYVFPDFGMGTFLFGTIVSLIGMHVVLAAHRHAANAKKGPAPDDETPRALCAQPLRMCGTRVTWTYFSRFIVVILLCGTITMVCFGITVTSFAFEFKGLAGWALELIGTPSYKTYSLVSLGLEMPGAAMDPNSIFIRVLQVTFFIFSIGMPLLHLLSMLLLWVVPMTSRGQRRLFVICEVLNAWSALDVFIIAVIAALLEVRQFAAFIIGDRCDAINKLAAKYMGAMLDNDAKCFDVIATLHAGCWLLFGACLVYTVVGTLVMRTCHSAMRERDDYRRRSAMASLNAGEEYVSTKTRKQSCRSCFGCFQGFLFRAVSDDEPVFSS
eukprot:TRINITY_DN1886_c0_g1_i2.p2 TRINITY_DN1886_c0_g1~~TRINITY_DN1886_c0_g1_i2.p2  ORF type:complete len:383 (-),score=130.37 TRINITY_DN1886_c0_g1_i2:315-1463(-)